MCLSTVDRITRRPIFRRQQEAWKVMMVDGGLRFPYRGIKYRVPEGEWLNEFDYRANSNKEELKLTSICDDKFYNFGFHVFMDRQDALDYKEGLLGTRIYKVVPVKCRKTVATGVQEVYICREIKNYMGKSDIKFKLVEARVGVYKEMFIYRGTDGNG